MFLLHSEDQIRYIYISCIHSPILVLPSMEWKVWGRFENQWSDLVKYYLGNLVLALEDQGCTGVVGSQRDVSYQPAGYWLLAAHSNNHSEVDIGFLVEGSHGEGTLVG